jgi:hypothetical protein
VATYYVYSGAGGANTGGSWANAYVAFGSAVTAASADGDIILVHYTHQEENGADTTYTFGNNVRIVSVDKDSSDAPTVMGTGGWIGNSTTNRFVRMAGSDRRLHFHGITLRTAGSTADEIGFGATSSGTNQTYENCYFWAGNTAATFCSIDIGLGGYGFFRFVGCTFRFGATTQFVGIGAHCEFLGCSVSSSGSTPTTLIGTRSTSFKASARFSACDLSLITGTLVGNIEGRHPIIFERCKFGSAVTVMASQTTNPTEDSASVTVLDCDSGDVHYRFEHHDALGSTISETGIYLTAGAAAQSWKIVTTANVKPGTPYRSPWITMHNMGSSSITPYLEILRDGSTTAYTDAEVWAEAIAKTTSGFPLGTFYTDGAAILASGTSQANGAGLGSWTGESGTAWSGKIDSGASLTPAEVGGLTMRVSVQAASSTVYVDPQIRT